MLGTMIGIYVTGLVLTLSILIPTMIMDLDIKAEISTSEASACVILWPIVLCLLMIKGLIEIIKRLFFKRKMEK